MDKAEMDTANSHWFWHLAPPRGCTLHVINLCVFMLSLIDVTHQMSPKKDYNARTSTHHINCNPSRIIGNWPSFYPRICWGKERVVPTIAIPVTRAGDIKLICICFVGMWPLTDVYWMYTFLRSYLVINPLLGITSSAHWLGIVDHVNCCGNQFLACCEKLGGVKRINLV